MAYVSPFDERRRSAEPLAARPVGLAGARVALLDITKRQGAEFLDRIEVHLREAGAETFLLAPEIGLRGRLDLLWRQRSRQAALVWAVAVLGCVASTVALKLGFYTGDLSVSGVALRNPSGHAALSKELRDVI